MANRYPLILDTSDGNKIKELPAGDNLFLRNNNILDVLNIEALGVINAADVRVNGAKVVPQALLDLTDTPSTYSGQANKLLKVSSDETTLDFVSISDIGNITAGDIELTGDLFPETNATGNLGTSTNKFANVRATDLHGNLRANDGTLIFDAALKQIPYSVITGGPTSLSEFLNDTNYTTIAQVSAYIESTLTTSDFKGSVFGDDSTLIIDGLTSTINAATISGTFGGPVATSQITTDTINSGNTLLIRTAGTAFDETVTIQPAGGNTNINLNSTNLNINGTVTSTLNTSTNVNIGGNLVVAGATNISGVVSVSGTIDGDFIGSVFYDDSTLIIDGINGKIVSPNITGVATFEDDIVIQGNLTVNGTTTSVSTTNTTIKDNTITLNEGELGAGVSAGSSGIEIDRGSETTVSFVWDENIDKWSVGSQTLIANIFEGSLQGNVIGNTTGVHTGNVVGNVIGDITGDLIGSVFGDDSTLLIDGTNNTIVGPLTSVSWTTNSYTTIDVNGYFDIDVNGFLEIKPEFFQLNLQDDGYLQLNAGDGDQFGGGYVQINAGDGGSGVLGTGGYVQINAGDGTGNGFGSGGSVSINAGDGSGTGSFGGGYVQINAGNAGGGNLSGGFVDIKAGDSSGNSTGSYVQLRGGDANDGEGGEVRIYGGSSVNGNGGDVIINGGIATNGVRGNVIIDNAQITGDFKGSLFIDDSALLIDGLDGSVYAKKLRTSESSIALGFRAGETNQNASSVALGVYSGLTNQSANSIAIGANAGEISQGVSSIAIGGFAGRDSQGLITISIGQFAGLDFQGDRSIAIGAYAGQTNQGVDSISIGNYAGQTNQLSNTIIVNATGAPLNSTNQNGLFIKPIRPGSNINFLQYNAVSGEITYSDLIDIKGSVFADDSTLLVDAVNGTIPYSVLDGAPVNLSEFNNDLDYAGIVGITIQTNGLPVNTYMTGNLDAQGNNISNANLVGATGDLVGSVFADNSTPMVDAVNFTMFTSIMNLTPLATPPTPIEGMLAVANGTTWDPDTKGGAVSYPVYYDGSAWVALY